MSAGRTVLEVATGQRRASPRHYAESAEQRLFVQRWRLDPRTRDLPACAVPNAGRRGKAQAGIMKAEGMERGVPDWLCFARTAAHAGLALEFKRPDGGGALSVQQRQWHADLRANGWRVEVVTSAEAAWRVVVEYLGMAR